MISDGSVPAALGSETPLDPRVKVIDIDAYDNNTDAALEPGECDDAWHERLSRGTVTGTQALDAEGVAYLYVLGFDFSAGPSDRDLVESGLEGTR